MHSKRKPRWITGVELLDLTPSETKWFAYPLLAAGVVTLLTGSAKEAGKTTLMLTLLRCVLDREPFLDRRTWHAPVLYITEQSQTVFRRQADTAFISGREDLHIWAKNDTFGRPWPEIVARVREKVMETRAGIIVFDTLPDILGLDGDAENTAGTVLKALDPLRYLAGEHRSVVAVWHDRKAKGSTVSSARGSTAIAGKVDLVARLRRASRIEDRRRVLSVIGRVEYPEKPLYLKLTEDGEYVYDNTEIKLLDQDVSRNDMLLAVFPAQPITRAALEEIAKPLAIPSRTLTRILDDLLESGKVERVAQGVYQLVAKP